MKNKSDTSHKHNKNHISSVETGKHKLPRFYYSYYRVKEYACASIAPNNEGVMKTDDITAYVSSDNITEYVPDMPIVFWLALIVILLLYLAITLSYMKTPYFQCTRKSYRKMMRDKGSRGEYAVYRKLKNFPGKKYFLFDLLLPLGGVTTEIDVIMIHKSGVYVIESKNYSGVIYGEEHKGNWCQFFNKSSKYNFYNPINQNETHIKAIKKLSGNITCHNIVVFGDECLLKIKINRDDLAVIQLPELEKTCRQLRRRNRNAEINVDEVYNQLCPYISISRKKRKQHIKRIKKAQRTL